MLKNAFLDSTKQLVAPGRDGNRSFAEVVANAPSRGTETSRELEDLPSPLAHQAKNGIVISSEISVTVSERGGAEHSA
jgi:hypothetical protein